MNWIPCTCPECGNDELADAEALARGLVLVCPECGAHMEADDE